MEIKEVSGLVDEVELKLSEYKEVKKKEDRELENRVESLTEENRDINSLLWSDAKCLQSIADKQAQKLAENALRIEALENREMLLTQNVNILKKELEKTRAALDKSNWKIKLKDDFVAAAVSVAERSLWLADRRAADNHERIEELTRQLKEAEKKDSNRHRVRHICWPWKAFKLNPTNNTANGNRKVRHMLPEMQAFLHYH
ncbi:Hypothetical predicted protein [Olea europaea subsp. europaea]|uniref:Uncharacterized protein n=1 Tax=Olea europaea subsp. europaea TaxID=158383 RepID=A0A8S0Q178_OLEEU|nr:Hypothetical predicted protein [Olea europaea subsp. europaea]